MARSAIAGSRRLAVLEKQRARKALAALRLAARRAEAARRKAWKAEQRRQRAIVDGDLSLARRELAECKKPPPVKRGAKEAERNRAREKDAHNRARIPVLEARIQGLKDKLARIRIRQMPVTMAWARGDAGFFALARSQREARHAIDSSPGVIEGIESTMRIAGRNPEGLAIIEDQKRRLAEAQAVRAAHRIRRKGSP